MFIRLASFSTLPALFLAVIFLTSCSSGPNADDFDISGFKLGFPNTPDLKKKVEAMPEGYKCLAIEVGEKLMGYSCYAPVAPGSAFSPLSRLYTGAATGIERRDLTHYLLYLFDKYSGEIWLIHKEERLEKRPLRATILAALRKKYGRFTDDDTRFEGDRFRVDNFWIFDWNGKKVTRRPKSAAIKDSEITNLTESILTIKDHLASLTLSEGKNLGVNLTAQLMCFFPNDDCDFYSLTLYDPRLHYYRMLVAETQAAAAKKAEEERKKAVSAPKNF